MAFTPKEETWLSETWKRQSRDLRLIGRKIGFKDFMDFKWFFKDFVKLCEKAGVIAPSPNPPYYSAIWDIVDFTLNREENTKATEEYLHVSLEEIEPEEEEVTSLPDLLKKLGTPELPQPDDPMAPILMEELVRELAERLKDAEYEKGKIRVTVAGKKRIWGAKKVHDFVDELYSKMRSLEGDKARLLEERKKFREVQPVKLRILQGFREGIIDYTAGSVVETRDIDWIMGLVEKGLAERVAVEVPVGPPPPLKELTDEEIKKLENVFKASMSAAGLYPPRFISEFRVEIDATKFLPFGEARDRIENLAREIIERSAPPRVPTMPRRRVRYPLIPPAVEAVELEATFKDFLTEVGITMADYRRLETIGKFTMREEYRRWKQRPY